MASAARNHPQPHKFEIGSCVQYRIPVRRAPLLSLILVRPARALSTGEADGHLWVQHDRDRVKRWPPISHGASRVAFAFLVYMLSPLPRRSGWAYFFAHSPPAVSVFPERVVGSACASSFSRLARRSLALRPAHSRCHQFVTRIPKASATSSPP